jgi:hypothetical protein
MCDKRITESKACTSKQLKSNSYKKKQWRPPRKKKLRGLNNLRNWKAHSNNPTSDGSYTHSTRYG